MVCRGTLSGSSPVGFRLAMTTGRPHRVRPPHRVVRVLSRPLPDRRHRPGFRSAPSLVGGLLVAVWGGIGCAGQADQSAPPPGSATATGQVVIDSQPFVDVSATGPGGTMRFGRVIDATRLSSGLIVVADVAEGALVFVDSSGAVIRRAGRRGAGPGEHQYLAWLEQCATDSLFAWDPILGRVDVVDTLGRVVRAFRLPGRPARLSCAGNGRFAVVMRQAALRLPSAESPRYRANVIFANASGDSIGALGEIEVGQNRPLAAITQFAMTDEWLYVGGADSALVRAYGLDGSTRGTIVTGKAGRPATNAHYDRAIDKLVAGMTDSAERARIRAQLAAIPRPEHLPAYSAIAADPSGNLWTVTSIPGDGATTIQVNSIDGVEIGTARLPFEFELCEVGIGYVLGVYQLGDGEQHVVGYRTARVTASPE